MIILDTQPISQLQMGGKDADRLAARLLAEPAWMTVISPYEQFRECLGNIHSENSHPDRQIPEFDRLRRLVRFYAAWSDRILPFDDRAASILRDLPPDLKRRLKAMDSRIAAICLAQGGTLISANLRDFRQVPGLVVEDWLQS